MEEVILTIVGLVATYFIIFRYYEMSFVLSLVFALPMLLLSLCLLVVFQTLVCFNKFYSSEDEFRVTRFHWLLPKLNVVLMSGFEQFYRDYNEAILALTGEEKMTIQIEEPGKAREYVPKAERDDDRPATFIMKKLSARKKAKLRDGTVGLDDDGTIDRFRNNFVAWKLVLAQLNGWKNIEDNGQEVDFNPKETEDCFDMLPDEIQDELIDEFGSVGVQRQQDDDEDEVDVDE